MIEGLIIPRSYNAYINKTDPVGVLNALQLPNVMDSAPTAGSNKPVTSSGIKAALDSASGATETEINAINQALSELQEGVETAQGDINDINTVLAGKQDTLTFDTNPLDQSANPVTSDGIKNAIDEVDLSLRDWTSRVYFATAGGGGELFVEIPDFPDLERGRKIEIVTDLIDVLDSDGFRLTINNTITAPILVSKNNNFQPVISHMGRWEEEADESERTCDAGKHLVLVYDGTDWIIMGNPILCSYFTSNNGTAAKQRNSYIVYADGLIHQWGTMDYGSAARDIRGTVNLLITHKASGYMTNVTPVAPADQEYYVGSIGIKAQTVSSMILDFYGSGNNDKSRWLKWEALGI